MQKHCCGSRKVMVEKRQRLFFLSILSLSHSRINFAWSVWHLSLGLGANMHFQSGKAPARVVVVVHLGRIHYNHRLVINLCLNQQLIHRFTGSDQWWGKEKEHQQVWWSWWGGKGFITKLNTSSNVCFPLRIWTPSEQETNLQLQW